ncbi:hypothetical protein Pmar_PMAR011284 [Perkinsus marinus ATCC 50983]|uniref:Uncharacterized protein n=1 Tax=Perkinsus marinus (strain ATCC 50983 / TXsc) TaxID=423536 RepID=C5L1Q4_PERM5|nr:hypothetical protein Pmar_PMAR011284 [Perkinsus marinus ATCC 50983]EER09339.1 hypothetical protein Pmar_PMAR011284 [Perkinsus marinus ATCC 50983]|eukprot:XP_002777523.1 hypothetical protein Pmar_PMAR011284 [Perkinsus marinus ATCC 50983]
MKLPSILAILFILGVVIGDVHVDDAGKIISEMMMDKQVDNGGHVSEFVLEQSSLNNLGDSPTCVVCSTCPAVEFISPICWPLALVCGKKCERCC